MLSDKNKQIALLYVVWVLAITSSCDKEKNSRTDSVNNSVVDSISDVSKPDILINENEPFRIEDLNSPAGLVIAVLGLSDIDGEYYFFPGGKVVNRYYQESALAGDWSMVGSKIKITYRIKYFRNGIGEPTAPPGTVPGNYDDRFDKYEYLSEDFTDTEEFEWAAIKADIGGRSNFYELKSWKIADEAFPSVIDLERH